MILAVLVILVLAFRVVAIFLIITAAFYQVITVVLFLERCLAQLTAQSQGYLLIPHSLVVSTPHFLMVLLQFLIPVPV
jgi:hypothetical protein